MYDLSDALFGGDVSASPEKAVQRTGISLARVTDIKDPKNWGRVKCTYISSEKDAVMTGWIYCLTMFGGNQNGAFFHPNVGDIVGIAYENGNVHRPFVIGSLWIGKNKPPEAIQDGKNEVYKFITPNKSYVEFTDTKGKEKITAATPKKRTAILDDEKKQMSVTDGKTSITIDEGKGLTEIKCDKKLTIKVGSGVTIECDGTTGAVKIKANKSINLEAAQINVKASGTAEISSSGAATLKSNGMLTIKGTLTKIN